MPSPTSDPVPAKFQRQEQEHQEDSLGLADAAEGDSSPESNDLEGASSPASNDLADDLPTKRNLENVQGCIASYFLVITLL